MISIYVKMFGAPEVIIDENKVIFPFKKVEALFYYLVRRKKVTRDELVNLLWGDLEEEIARKNLRNAIYKIKKTLDMDIIDCTNKSIVILKEEVVISDVDILENEYNKCLEIYKGEFLENFSIRDTDEYEDWTIGERERLNLICIKNLRRMINEDLINEKYDFIEVYANKIISIDEYDESSYEVLMKTYAHFGYIEKVINTYNKLTEKLKTELHVNPDINTKKIFEDIMTNRQYIYNDGDAKEKIDFLYGRQKEIRGIKENFGNFLNDKKYKSLLLTGESGVGKTKIVEDFVRGIDKDKIYIFKGNCFQGEENLFLKSWYKILSQFPQVIEKEKIKISEFHKNIMSYISPGTNYCDNVNSDFNLVFQIYERKYQIAEKAIMDIIYSISNSKKIVFIFEDIQWIDEMSLFIIKSILLHQDNGNIIFIGTSRNVYRKCIKDFIISLTKYTIIDKINIETFSNKELEEFVDFFLRTIKLSKFVKEDIYNDTHGNPFLIIEILECIKSKRDINELSDNMQNFFQSIFLDISEDAQKFLNIACVFKKDIPFDIVNELLGKDDFITIDLIDELQNKNIIYQSDYQKSMCFRFENNKIREYIQNGLSMARKRLIFNRLQGMLYGNVKVKDIYNHCILDSDIVNL